MESINFSDILRGLVNWLNDWGLLAGIIGTVATALGALAKRLWDKTAGTHLDNKIKKEVAELVVKYVEQVFKNLKGSQKLEKAIEAGSKMLEEKGINITELELRVYIEAALASFNNAFSKDIQHPPVTWEDAPEDPPVDETELIDPEEELEAIEDIKNALSEEAAG